MKTDFQNFILDARIAILSMTVPRKEAIQRVRALADNLVLHLALIVSYPDNQEQKHWRKEVANFANQIGLSAKRSAVRLPDDLLLKLVYEEPIGTDKDKLAILQWMQRKMNGKAPDVDLFAETDFEALIKATLKSPLSIYA